MITDEQFVLLYKRWEEAERIFQETGYSDWQGANAQQCFDAADAYQAAEQEIAMYGPESQFAHLVKDVVIANLQAVNIQLQHYTHIRYQRDVTIESPRTPDEVRWIRKRHQWEKIGQEARNRLNDAIHEYAKGL